MDVGGPPHKWLMKSIEIFGTRIAPKVREALSVEKIQDPRTKIQISSK